MSAQAMPPQITWIATPPADADIVAALGQRPPGRAAAAARPSATSSELYRIAAACCGWVSRPRARLTLTGVLLLVTGGMLVTSSVWTLPLVLIGALMVSITWIGHRLDGRLAVEWGASGTELTFRARINASPTAADRSSAPKAERLAGGGPATLSEEVIDGEAHTVEIAADDVKALLAAVESGSASTAATDLRAPADATFRVARLRDAEGPLARTSAFSAAQATTATG